MELVKNLTVKNFIADLPRILNANFKAIEDAFNGIYNAVTNTAHVAQLIVDGKITANTVSANNIIVTNGTKEITFAELLERLEACEAKLGITPSTPTNEI